MTKPACANCDMQKERIRKIGELASNYCLSCEPPFGGACKWCEIRKIQVICRVQTNKVLDGDMPEPLPEAKAKMTEGIL
jgi:hypothetical protein